VAGLAGGVAAAAMEWGLHFGSEALIGRVVGNASFAVFQFHWAVLVLPAIGGLVSGVVVTRFCRAGEGYGTGALITAFHRDFGDLPLRGPAIRAATAAGVIACGGSAGPEGPIAALGAALGSSCGRLFRLPPRQTRNLLLAGCAAGIGAIFRCPLGGALFAAGIIYSESDFEAEALVPSIIASVVGYSIYMALWGHGQPLLSNARDLAFGSPLELIPFAVLGVACGLATILLSTCLHGVERFVRRASWLPRWLAPALGGLATGATACLLPQVIDGRFAFIQQAMDGGGSPGGVTWWWLAGLFAMILVAKCLATSFTLGSGASGGLLGPSLFIGGIAGAMVGACFEAMFPGLFPEPLRRALIPVGMAGVLAAGMRTPLAAVVMVVEMTDSYGLVVPLMLVSATAYLVGHRWGLNREQVPTSSHSPVHGADAMIYQLKSSRVADLFQTDWKLTLAPESNLKEIVEQIEPGEQPTFAVVEDRSLVGVVSLADVGRIVATPDLGSTVIAYDIMRETPAKLFPDQSLYQALELFGRQQCDVLPVVLREQPNSWLGMLTRNQVYLFLKAQIAASKQHILQEHAGLKAIEEEAGLEQLLMAVLPAEGARVERLTIPIEMEGQSIRQSRFQSRYGSQVIAIVESDGRIQSPPDLDRPLSSQHRFLTIVGINQPTKLAA
jgi:CIC family chloride channel protein